ncbi:MAG TPA: M14 family zinc carboxypeptidase [Rhodanobacteraceae bacterium]|nr:M14 family zinc carboxypeptidase [Rhodanobacteraceae bacterium]
MRKIFFGILVAFVSMQIAHAEEWVVEAHYPDQAALQRAARHFEHVILDKKRNVLRVDTTDQGIAKLEDEGLTVTIDQAATAKLRMFYASAAEAASRGLGLNGIPGYECFRTVEETYQTMDDLASGFPDIAAVDDIGPSWQKTQDSSQGYEMRAMHITNFATAAADPNRPKMAAYFSIHAREYTPAEIGTRFAEWLVNNYGTDPEATWLVDHNDFHLILMANPDSRKLAEQQIYQRKNMDTINGPCGSDDEFEQFGVDLNRNFPWHWDITRGQGSDDDTCSQTFHGPYQTGSNHNDHIQGTPEPETINLFSYVAGTCDSNGDCTGGLFSDQRDGPMDPSDPSDDPGDAAPRDKPGFFVDMHSNAALVLWPWGDTATDSPNVTDLTTLGRRIAYFNGYTPEQSNELYLTDGTTDDSMYGLLGVAAYTIETNGSDFFEDCASFEGNTAPTNLDALRYIARTLHAPYELPAGPDTIQVTASPDLVIAGDTLNVQASLDSSRFNNSNGTQPVHNIASALAYLDALPWDDTDPGTAMQAGDGAFDSAIEVGLGAIPTTGLSSGRHFVYVQATDVIGNAGTPNAAFFDVGAADEVTTLVGQVTDLATGSAVAATVTLNDPDDGETRQTTSDATTGDYAAHTFAGTFNVSVSAPRYLTQAVQGIALTGGGTATQNFALLHDCEIFSDDVENGSSLWTAQTPWVIVNGVGTDTTHVWNTPNYGDDISRSLTTATSYDLTGYSDVTLDFDDRCDTESGFDFGNVEYSTNGSTWNGVYACTGQTAWQTHHLNLPADANGSATLKIRFRLQSDSFQNAPGWALDNIRLAAGGEACTGQQVTDRIFADGFDP